MTSAAIFLFTLLLGSEGTKDDGVYGIEVDPPKEDMAFAVLAVSLRPGREVGRVELLRADRTPVPVQWREEKGELKVTWIADQLRKGQHSALSLRVRNEKDPVREADRIAVKRDGSSIAVGVAGKPFTRLVADPKERKPYLYPILLDGVPLTRHYPMEKFPGEATDHPHQRSFWFTHGLVNDVDFWSESSQAGRVVQRAVREAEGGPVFAAIVTEDEWIDPDGERVLADESNYRFYDLGPAGRMIDFSIVLTAKFGPVAFGDTKEGTFGIRIAESMKEARGGRIENSRGLVTEAEAWGKPAEWVDCSGKIDGKTYGIAILDHPSSFRHPTPWHVRGYGLFAANPFGLKEFTGDKAKDGTYRLENGKSVLFRYRVLFHPGTAHEAKVAEAWSAFADPPQVRAIQATGD